VVPSGHTQLLLADGRRAVAWERGLARAGFTPVRLPTRGQDAERADFAIAVPALQARAARAFVSEVVNGRRRLPHVAPLSRSGLLALALAIGVVAAIVLVGLVGG
jgi:hypothetical protein